MVGAIRSKLIVLSIGVAKTKLGTCPVGASTRTGLPSGEVKLIKNCPLVKVGELRSKSKGALTPNSIRVGSIKTVQRPFVELSPWVTIPEAKGA